MIITEKTAVVTGAGSGIGQAVAVELAERGIGGAGARRQQRQRDQGGPRDQRPTRAADRRSRHRRRDRRRVPHPRVRSDHGQIHVPTICIPAAGISRDQLAVKLDRQSGKAAVYPIEKFREVADVNLIAPTYWALETIARIAEDRHRRGLTTWSPEEDVQGTIIFIGSVSSSGNTGQVAYAGAKAGLEGVAATLAKEAMHYGVRCAVIHPGYTDTPMVRALGEDYIKNNILPYTQLHRLIAPAEIADAIYFLICNSAVSGQLWADAGWHPTA